MTWRCTLLGLTAVLGTALVALPASAAELGIGSGAGLPGETVEVEVSLDDQGDSVFRVAMVLALPAGFTPSAAGNRADCRFLIPDAELGFFSLVPAFCSGPSCTGIAASVASGERLANGGLFSCRIVIAPDANPAVYAFGASEVHAFGLGGNRLPAAVGDGAIQVSRGAALNPGVVVAAAGAETTVEVRLGTNVLLDGLTHELTLPPQAVLHQDAFGGPSCRDGNGVAPECISFAFLPEGCVPEETCNGVRAVVDAACTVAPILTDRVIYDCDIGVRVDTVAGHYPIVGANATAVDLTGAPVPVAASAGRLVVDEGAFVSLSVAGVGVRPGESGQVVVNLSSNLIVDGVRFELGFEPEARIAADERGRPRCTTLAEGREALLTFLPQGCAPAGNCSAVRVLFPPLGLAPFASFTPLYRCAVDVTADAPPGSYPLRIANPTASGPNGPDLPGTVTRDASVVVQDSFPATIVIGSANGLPGERASFEVTLEAEVDVAGTQNYILFTPSTRIAALPNGRPACRINPAISIHGGAFSFQPTGCDPTSRCALLRALVLSLDSVDPIPDGSVLYSCEVEIAPATPAGSYPLEILSVDASNPDGVALASTGRIGVVVVGVAPATPTGTPPFTPQPTRTLPPRTSTATAIPTATATQPPDDEDDGCAVTPAPAGSAWWLLLPIAALWFRRQRTSTKV